MPTIWQKVTELNLAALPDAEIATTLSAITNGPIDVASVLFWLAQNELCDADPLDAGKARGVLVDLIIDGQTPTQIASGLRTFISHVYRPGSKTIATHQSTWANMAASLLAALQQLGTITSQQVTAFYALDGGKVFPNGVTTQQVTDARTAQQVAASIATLEALWVTKYANPVLDGIQDRTYTTEAEIDAAVTTIAGGG